MSDRPSMWSQRVRQTWLYDVRCPACGAMNLPGRKQDISINEDQDAECAQCGHVWEARRPRVEPVT